MTPPARDDGALAKAVYQAIFSQKPSDELRADERDGAQGCDAGVCPEWHGKVDGSPGAAGALDQCPADGDDDQRCEDDERRGTPGRGAGRAGRGRRLDDVCGFGIFNEEPVREGRDDGPEQPVQSQVHAARDSDGCGASHETAGHSPDGPDGVEGIEDRALVELLEA